MNRYFIFYLFAYSLFFSSCKETRKSTTKPSSVVKTLSTPTSALHDYLNNGDAFYQYVLKDSLQLDGIKIYDLELTSQRWREFTWKHQLSLFVPNEIDYDGALLFITGGDSKNEKPNWKVLTNSINQITPYAIIAKENKAILAIIRQVPMQPLYDENLVEDQLISYTLHNYKIDKDLTWPLLFPMVKSAVRAMDAVQDFSKQKLHQSITRFTVTGASKRGWTTWLTGASDTRVEAIAPMVIDVLNMPKSLDYQLTAWNQYSDQINDYIKLEIPQTVQTKDGNSITQMIDPYSYRDKLTMPKIIFMGTNDQYWPIDAVKNYINDIPGENYIHYTPNAGHNLGGGEKALKSLSCFWGETLTKKAHPDLSYEIAIKNNTHILVVTSHSKQLKAAYQWTAYSKDRDFRDEIWEATPLKKINNGILLDTISYPKTGFKSFYVELEFSDSKGSTYSKTTRAYVTNNEKIL
ncbi:PhoPQ-activated pathogenicity-related family protein [Yeosuana marina]|uniref:PhoPQ-activated pathogenicity-related family protein n=1 Tax=Yeosuana marina TaxID=1565536 RepID=UPI0030C7BCBD